MNEPKQQSIQVPVMVMPRRDRPPAALPEGATPMQMLQAAMQRGVDTEQLKELMALQERWEANEARKAFVAAMAVFKSDPPVIIKDKHVKFRTRDGDDVEYSHAGLGTVTSAIVAGLAKVGISHRWQVEQPTAGAVKVTCIITHERGHSEQTSMESPVDGSGKKNPIQQLASAKTYLERYTLLAITGLATDDDDDDGRSTGDGQQHECISEKQIADLDALIIEWKLDKPALLDYYAIQKLGDIWVENYDRLCREVVHKGKLKAERAKPAATQGRSR